MTSKEFYNETVRLVVFKIGCQLHFYTEVGFPIVILTERELNRLCDVLEKYKESLQGD